MYPGPREVLQSKIKAMVRNQVFSCAVKCCQVSQPETMFLRKGQDLHSAVHSQVLDSPPDRTLGLPPPTRLAFLGKVFPVVHLCFVQESFIRSNLLPLIAFTPLFISPAKGSTVVDTCAHRMKQGVSAANTNRSGPWEDNGGSVVLTTWQLALGEVLLSLSEESSFCRKII